MTVLTSPIRQQRAAINLRTAAVNIWRLGTSDVHIQKIKMLMKNVPLFVLALFVSNPTMAAELTPDEIELFMTRTTNPQPSPELVSALELDVAPWHQKGAPNIRVKISDDAVRRSTEAALQALTSLDAAVLQNDFDRAWVTYQTGSALKTLGRNPEARTAFERLLNMPHTKIQAKLVSVALHNLGDEQQLNMCPPGKLARSDVYSTLAYPKIASTRGIEGWVQPWVDVQLDGSISSVVVHSSSMRVFEQPVVEWLLKQRWQTDSGSPIEHPCFVKAKQEFTIRSKSAKVISIERMGADTEFSYHSIGAAIRVRAEARAAALAKQ